MKLQFSGAYPKLTVRPISLGNLLRCLARERLTQWDLILSQAKFAYNTLVNRSKDKTLLKIVYAHPTS